jgi:anti-sigma factor RsiW
MTAQHPDDETLNEYLDDALDAAIRAHVAAHLAACPHCAARLESLRALFTALEALPEEPLARDLSAGVLARLPRPVEKLAVPPTMRWVVAAQALAAVMLLAMVAPVVLASLPIAEMTLPVRSLLQSVTEPLAGLTAQVQSLGERLAVWNAQALAGVRALVVPLVEISTPWLGAGLAAAFVLWVLGNGLLLRQALLTRSR